MGNIVDMDDRQHDQKFSAHQMHMYALYDDIRRSGRVKTMLQSDIIKRMNDRQDLGDRSDHGNISGEDIQFVMRNFSALRDCHRKIILMPSMPPPPLVSPAQLKQTQPKSAKRKRRPSTPISTAMNALKKKGYTCRVRHKGALPDGDFFLFTYKQYKEYHEEQKTTAHFSGDVDLLKQLIGDEITVEPREDNTVQIQRGVAEPAEGEVQQDVTQEPPTPVDYKKIDETPVQVPVCPMQDDDEIYLEP